jgi:cytochrome c oxidase subunit 3
MLIGIINIIHGNWYGHYLFFAGALILTYMMFGWFGTVIEESLQGLHSEKMDKTYRWGMFWFIASEVAFFGIFFGSLFYARHYAVPALAGLIGSKETHILLWPSFQAAWPLFTNPNPKAYPGPHEVIPTFGIPALNPLILLTSAAMVTFSHWFLKKGIRKYMLIFLLCTILLGLAFLSLQAYEYTEAYTHMGLTLASGIYGTTFFMLTGFHAAHVTIGAIMLIVIFIRCYKGHFLPEHHFAFEATSWYWHFVDVIWLFLFVFVYWL